MSACTDAINAANHYKSAGRSRTNIQPSTSTYFGDVARALLDANAAGGVAARAAAVAAPPRPKSECTVALACNREKSSANRAELDCYGTVAVVCSHTIPCLGLALAMTAHEQHSFYQRIFMELLEIRPDVQFIYLDLMCRFADKVDAVIKDLQERNVLPPGDVKPRLLLPWMHAFDHNKECQRDFNPMLQEGVGRRVGEQTEQFWSLIKAFAKIGRYLSWYRWWDGMNLLFWVITLRAQSGAQARRHVHRAG
ncbi:MAG: hypothetical protein NTV69_20235 [Caldilinea sp.]|nr:hypothetical protein [Caldilinea sp.]